MKLRTMLVLLFYGTKNAILFLIIQEREGQTSGIGGAPFGGHRRYLAPTRPVCNRARRIVPSKLSVMTFASKKCNFNSARFFVPRGDTIDLRR